MAYSLFRLAESNQYSFYPAPAAQGVYSYPAPASQPSRETTEPAKPVYLPGGRAPLGTQQNGNSICYVSEIVSASLPKWKLAIYSLRD